MPMPSKAVVLFDATGAANTAFSTGVLDTSDYDNLWVQFIPVGGAAAASTMDFLDGAVGSAIPFSLATQASAAAQSAGWGPGVAAPASGRYIGGLPVPLSASVAIGVGALGVGISARIRVVGRRQFRGSVPNRNTVDGVTTRTLD